MDMINDILDEAFICHVGFAVDGRPFVIPTNYARVGKQLLIQASAASRTLNSLSKGIPVCVTVTLVDGLVLGRSAFHHSVNYRSAVIFGVANVTAVSVLLGRLYYLQFIRADEYRTLAEGNRVKLQLIAPVRGLLLDKAGVPLANNQKNFRLFCLSYLYLTTNLSWQTCFFYRDIATKDHLGTIRCTFLRFHIDLSREYNVSGENLMVLKEERNGNE